jgi:hypothetical protein
MQGGEKVTVKLIKQSNWLIVALRIKGSCKAAFYFIKQSNKTQTIFKRKLKHKAMIWLNGKGASNLKSCREVSSESWSFKRICKFLQTYKCKIPKLDTLGQTGTINTIA